MILCALFYTTVLEQPLYDPIHNNNESYPPYNPVDHSQFTPNPITHIISNMMIAHACIRYQFTLPVQLIEYNQYDDDHTQIYYLFVHTLIISAKEDCVNSHAKMS